MVKDDNVNITLEVCKDKTSGKLYIRAHFNSKAPNVFKDKDFYTWMPTIEEQNLLNDAFEFMPMGSSPTITETKKPGPEMMNEGKSEQGIDVEEEIPPKPEFKTEINEVAPQEPPKMDTPQETPKMETPQEPPMEEKPQESDVFEVTNENIQDDFSKDDNKMEEPTIQKIPEQKEEKPGKEDTISSRLEEDDGIIVEADSDAIEAALEKHMGSRDKTIVEADEKTIIDRVLKQKKKGKWRE